MKKIIGIGLILILILSGCGGTDLASYQKAIEETGKFEQGEMGVRVDATLTFNEEGTTFEQQRDMSYYETIALEANVQFDASDGQLNYMSQTYYNFGGLGFDMTLYRDDEETLIEVPIIDKFIRVESEGIEASTQELETEEIGVFKALLDQWNKVLGEEDVLSGKKAYVMTDKGQIKTTTYKIKINDDQFQMLKESMLDIIGEEGVVESLLAQGQGYIESEMKADEVEKYLQVLLGDISLVSCEGEAFVDFDGRLVKQTISIDLANNLAEKGQVATMHFDYKITYDNLGNDIEIVMPDVAPEDLIESDGIENIDSYLPEGLF